MAENEFEKKVQRLMDEFNIVPPASVWEKVEKQIGQKKRRRVLAWLIPFLLLVLVTGSYLLIHQNSNKQKEQITKEYQPEDKAIKNPGDTTNEPAIADMLNNQNDNTSIAGSKNVADSAFTVTNKKEIPTHYQKKETLPAIVNNQAIQASKESLSDLITEENIKPCLTNKTKNNNQETLIAKENKANSDPVGIVIPGQLNSGTVATDSILASLQGQKQKKQEKKDQKLQWGLDLFYGRADVVEGIFDASGDKALSQDMGSIPGGNTAPDYYKQPKAGPSFNIGVFVQKNISKRSSISAGLNYSMQKTKIETGGKIDSAREFNNGSGFTAVNDFYRSISDSSVRNNVTNKYQFFQLPVLWNYRFNNSKKLPLYLNAGIGLSALFTSDALIYDKNYGAFYTDNSLYKKMQFNFLIGMSAQINFKQAALILGPQMQYAPTNLLKDKSYYGSQHLFNYGLHASLLLNKK